MSFALTAALAHKTGANVLLRIDDMDRQRMDARYVDDIFETLHFLGIFYNEGPNKVAELENEWSQLHRMALYNEALQQLVSLNAVFACVCTRAQLQTKEYQCSCADKQVPLDTSGAAWRLRTDQSLPLILNTLVDGVIKAILPDDMRNFVIRKKDGYPAYQLTSLIDDVYFNVDLIVRGADLWPSTLAQCYLANVLALNAFSNVTFHHHDLLMENENAKLSKSAGATSINYLRQQGYTAAQVYALIGNMLKASNSKQTWPPEGLVF